MGGELAQYKPSHPTATRARGIVAGPAKSVVVGEGATQPNQRVPLHSRWLREQYGFYVMKQVSAVV
jgi:hypothetical protein